MNFLFLHHNYPAQFRFIAAALAADASNTVCFLTEHIRSDLTLPGVKKGLVPVPEARAKSNPAERDMLELLRRAEAFANAMISLRGQGFVPDVTYDHCGWGCGAFTRDIFPQTRRVSYFEWFYNKTFPYDLRGEKMPPTVFAPYRMRNQFQLDALVDCDVAVSPTEWQKERYPALARPKIQVIHDGIDTGLFCPDPSTPRFADPSCPGLEQAAEIVTYTSRAFEPLRGFGDMYRAIPEILAARPGCHVALMGEDRVSYGSPRRDGRTWLTAMREEVATEPGRVHVLGFGSYPRYLRLLRASSAHVYLTAPYVLSWSLLEAMSTGCLVVASDTPPVREVARHNENALLAPLNNPSALAAQVIDALERQEKLKRLRVAARQTILDKYDLKLTLPRHLRLVR